MKPNDTYDDNTRKYTQTQLYPKVNKTLLKTVILTT